MCAEDKTLNFSEENFSKDFVEEEDFSEDYPEYKMPDEIRALITDEFLKEFRRQLFKIFEGD
jgi:hypothetical protein